MFLVSYRKYLHTCNLAKGAVGTRTLEAIADPQHSGKRLDDLTAFVMIYLGARARLQWKRSDICARQNKRRPCTLRVIIKNKIHDRNTQINTVSLELVIYFEVELKVHDRTTLY